MGEEFCCAVCPAWDPKSRNARVGTCQLKPPAYGGESLWPTTPRGKWCLDGADEAGWSHELVAGEWLWLRVDAFMEVAHG